MHEHIKSISLRVYGDPAPKGSKRHIGGGRMIESSKKLPAWMAELKKKARQVKLNEPIDVPVYVEMVFWLPRPKRPRFPLPATKPDGDKLARAVFDGLEGGGLLRNDSRVVAHTVQKRYADEDNPTGAIITIQPVDMEKIGGRNREHRSQHLESA